MGIVRAARAGPVLNGQCFANEQVSDWHWQPAGGP